MPNFLSSFSHLRLAAPLLLASFLCTTLAPAKPDAHRPPNIILFLADDMGWTGLGCYGSDLHETPNLDALAARGMKFLDGYAFYSVHTPLQGKADLVDKYTAKIAASGDEKGMHRNPTYAAMTESLDDAVGTVIAKLEELELENDTIIIFSSDLGETTDLASANPEKAAELRKQLHDWRLSVDAQMPVPNPAYAPEKARGSAKDRGKSE